MTELLIKVQPEVAQEFKKISREVFQGNDNLTLQQAVQFLRLLSGGNHFERFWEIVEQIRERVIEAGGLSSKEIDHLVIEARARRRKSNAQ